MSDKGSESRSELLEAFGPFLDGYVKGQRVKVMIMGPDFKSETPSANLRRRLAELCEGEGLTVVAEHERLIEVGKKLLKSAFELTMYELAVAKWSDLVVLIPDSAGSLAELGYFGTRRNICEKMMIFMNSEHESEKERAYVWLGPGKAAANYKAEVAYVDYCDVEGIWQTILGRIEIERADKIREKMES